MMRLRWTLSGILLAGCGTDPSAVLTVTVDDIPGITQENTLTVSGNVTRSPETEEPVLVIAIAGGRTTIRDTLDPTGEFSLEIQLHQNQENQLAITASDKSGAVSDPVIAVVVHDNEGPRIASVLPSNQSGVVLSTPIEVVFEEPLTAGSASDGIALFHNSAPVAGTSTLSSDQLKLTFVPDQTLDPNSVYEVRINGFADEAGNPAGGGEEICFVTTFEGFPTDSAMDDGSDTEWFSGNPPTSLMFPDFRRIRFTRDGNTLHGIVQFNGPRTFGVTGDDNATLVIDIDIDQNASTGFRPVYDVIFSGEDQPESGMGGEFLIGIDPLPDLADSAYVGELINDDATFEIRDAFLPGVCGPYYGFDTDYLFGDAGDDGQFDLTVLSFAFADDGARLDAAPETGHFSVDVSAATAIVQTPDAQRITPTEARTHRLRPWPRFQRR